MGEKETKRRTQEDRWKVTELRNHRLKTRDWDCDQKASSEDFQSLEG